MYITTCTYTRTVHITWSLYVFWWQYLCACFASLIFVLTWHWQTDIDWFESKKSADWTCWRKVDLKSQGGGINRHCSANLLAVSTHALISIETGKLANSRCWELVTFTVSIEITRARVVTVCNPNDLDIWTDWCRLGLQFVVYKSAEQELSFIN